MARDLSEFDLAGAMRGLYQNMGYYVRIPKESSDAYEENYWHEIVDPDGKRRNRLEERDRFLSDVKSEIAFINGLKPGRLLDIGCGLGWLLSAVNKEWEKHGIEVSRFAAEYAQQYGEIAIGTLLESAYEEDSFDVVIMHHVVEHMDDPVSNLNRIKGILKQNGILIIGTPDFDSGCARRYGNNYRLLYDETHISLFSHDSMHRFLRDHDFSISQVDYPYFDTRHFNKDNLTRLLDTNNISPPFYGNFMTFYAVNN